MATPLDTIERDIPTQDHGIAATARDVYPEYVNIFREAGFAGLGRVVDYGCAEGLWAFPLAALNGEILGIDINPKAIDCGTRIAQAAGIHNLRFTCASTLSAVESSSVDGIVCIGTLQVLDRGALWHQFFADAKRILRPGSPMLLHYATPLVLGYRVMRLEPFRSGLGLQKSLHRMAVFLRITLRALLQNSINPDGHYYGVRRSMLLSLVRQYGFDEVAFSAPVTDRYAFRGSAWMLVRNGPAN